MAGRARRRARFSSVRVGELPSTIGTISERSVLRCEVCRGQYSAERGDYFLYRDDHVLSCCEQPLKLVRPRVTYEEVCP